MKLRLLGQYALALTFCLPAIASAWQDTATAEPAAKTETTTDPMILKIIEIGANDNHVQEHLDYLTNRIGPRLTGSEGQQAACEWARDEFAAMGLESRLEQWGEFPVGFERGASYGIMMTPKKMKLEFGTNAWTAGTKGRVSGKVVMAPKTMEEFESMKDSIKGAYVMMERPPRRRFRRRRGQQADAEPAKDEDPDAPKPMTREERQALREAITEAGPAGLITATNGDLILTGGRSNIDIDNLPTIPAITLLQKQWNEIKELMEADEDVQLAFDIRNHFRRGPIALNNVIADIKGTEFPDEYVIVGGHIDSWDGATGATDNGAGCATTLEAARILMAAGVKPRRTIRFMLWSGEEQGLLGSRAFVKAHREDVSKNVSAVFVHDGGTNYVSGIRCTEAMLPDFEKIFAPAMDLDERTPFEIQTIPVIRPTGGSDHVSFIQVGVPGFFWNQAGRATYRDTHHTQFDTYETVVPEYQKHSATVIAIGALGTANLDHLLPREGVNTPQ